MSKDKTVFTCSECGGTSPKWLGKCPHCQAWNTLLEGVAESSGAARHRYSTSQHVGLALAQPVMPLAAIEATDIERTPSGIDELDRVLGGGIVEGGVVLIGGDPGIGKSTLLLQALDALQRAGLPTLYVTGEESGAQIALRSRRLGLHQSQVNVLAEIQLEKILATLETTQPAVAVIDSIQTVYSDQLTSAPGSVAQVRECAAHLTRMAKRSGVAIVLVGHVTKEGALAGPRVLEHMVDTQIAPHERTTPAGRFVSEPGHNLKGEDIVWIDYDDAVSLHRVRPSNNPAERRAQRLASRTAADNRISFGCVNLPPSFYDRFIVPGLGKQAGVIYVLPETQPVAEFFGFNHSVVQH